MLRLRVLFAISFLLTTVSCSKSDSGVLNSAHAGWPPTVHAWLEEFNRQPVLFPTGNDITIWTIIQDYKHVLFMDKLPSYTIVPFKTSLAQKPFNTIIHVETETTSTGHILTRKAPLIAFIAGFTNKLSEPSNYRTMLRYAKRGYHVLVIPNSWTNEFIAIQPSFLPGNMPIEANFNLEILALAKNYIGLENITQTNLVGESYGGFLASAILGQDSISNTPEIDGSVTLVGPLLDAYIGTTSINKLLETQRANEVRCNHSLVSNLLNYMFAENEADLSEEAKFCSDEIIGYIGFQGKLKKMLVELTLYKSGVYGTICDNPIARVLVSLLPKLDHPDFDTYFRNFAPELGDLLDGPEGNLGYWLRIATQEGRPEPRIITARDDFLNHVESWNSNEYYEFNESNLIILPWGGHTGFKEVPMYETLLDLVF
jgi:hypothetical protein